MTRALYYCAVTCLVGLKRRTTEYNRQLNYWIAYIQVKDFRNRYMKINKIHMHHIMCDSSLETSILELKPILRKPRNEQSDFCLKTEFSYLQEISYRISWSRTRVSLVNSKSLKSISLPLINSISRVMTLTLVPRNECQVGAIESCTQLQIVKWSQWHMNAWIRLWVIISRF